ncbi:MAG TPA: intradiol ring-cleavage dioxygenase [Polyangia bacterium]
MARKSREASRALSTRRESLRLFGLAGVAAVGGCGSGGSTAKQPSAALPPAGGMGTPDAPATGEGGGATCVLRPQQTEGPYFLDGKLDRSDVRPDPRDGVAAPGAPLRLTFRVGRMSGTSCAPLPGAIVDIWQCDAQGVYSGFRDFGGLFDTTGRHFLRGFQTTGSDGACQFVTIYPGWYPGRSVHIHFKIRATESGRLHEITSQLYFPESLSDEVFTRAPYNRHAGRRTLNNADGIFQRGGSDLLLAPTTEGEGFAATFDVGLQIA